MANQGLLRSAGSCFLLLAAASSTALLGNLALAKKYSTSTGMTGFGSADAACRNLVGNKPHYKYDAPPEKRGNGVYWCYEKAKDDDKAERIYVGPVFEEEEPTPSQSGVDGGQGAPDLASGSKCTVEEIQRLVPGPTGQLTAAFQGLAGDDACGACNKESVRIGERVFAASRGSVCMNRYMAPKVPNHYFLRHDSLYIDSAYLQFFDAPRHPGPIFVGSEQQLRTLFNQLFTMCGLSKRCNPPKVSSGAELFEIIYGNPSQVCSCANLKMRASGRAADWNHCGLR